MKGLCGAHRVGKTSLARAYAEKRGVTFLQTSASAVFRDMGLDPAVTYDFGTRMDVQEEILKRFDQQFAKAPFDGITDRTPLDMLAYTVGDVSNQTLLPEHEGRLARYVEDCIAVTNKRFSLLLVIQPGVPVVYEEGKASLSNGYIEHLNSLVRGLVCDERIKVPQFYLPRHVTGMEERVTALDQLVTRVRKRAEAERLEDGVVLH